MEASENLLNKQVSDAKKFLKLVKKESNLHAKNRAKTDELVKKILAKIKLEKKIVKILMK